MIYLSNQSSLHYVEYRYCLVPTFTQFIIIKKKFKKLPSVDEQKYCQCLSNVYFI